MTWIAIALGEDLHNSMAMPCCLDGTDLAIWRGASGRVHVWGDRCPHRGMRLSQGFVRNEALSCIYHGWQYGPDGGCVSIPAHPDLVPPKTICATTYQTTEAHGLIWASLTKTSEDVPLLPAMEPVRSLHIDRDVDTVSAYFNAPGDRLIMPAGPHPMTLVLQPAQQGSTAVHTLTKHPADRVAVSRWIEAQRVHIEGAVA